MSRVKDVEWSVNHVAAHELQSYLNKKAADGFELVNALDSDGAALVIMSKDTSVKSDWKTLLVVVWKDYWKSYWKRRGRRLLNKKPRQIQTQCT